MCGIAGIFGKYDENQIINMVSSMHHRGPDDHGIYLDSQIALGMARLAIIDINPTGHQPMSTSHGDIWIVYNGELYNFKKERAILESYGYSFNSTSDTEVVLKMYQHYGDNFLLRLRGIFALAIYDKRKGMNRARLLLARDHFGIKPLLYSENKNNFIFASEIKSMLAGGVDPTINLNGLRTLLTFGSVYQPDTLINNVYMLPPAHKLILEPNKQKIIERYWSLELNRNKGVRDLPYEQQVSLMESTLRNTVNMQMISDVPLGAFLSGGIDSSILVAFMSQVTDHKIKTFSIGFKQEGKDIDETADAKRIANHIGTTHSEIIITDSDVYKNINKIAFALDQPSVDGTNAYFVSMASKKDVTVAISGTGGDEIFAGYPWFITMKKYQNNYKNRLLQHIDKYAFLKTYSDQHKIFGSSGAQLLLPTISKQKEYIDLKPIDELSSGTPIERVSGLVLRGYTTNQLLRDIDAVSMYNSLEVRVPYLDTEIVNLALSIPDNTKLHSICNNSENITYRESGAKRILIDIGKKLLPKDFDLQPKRGFNMPFNAWLHGSLNEILDDTLSSNVIHERNLFDYNYVKTIKERFNSNKIGWTQPWLLMMIELWHRNVIDGDYNE